MFSRFCEIMLAQLHKKVIEGTLFFSIGHSYSLNSVVLHENRYHIDDFLYLCKDAKLFIFALFVLHELKHSLRDRISKH